MTRASRFQALTPYLLAISVMLVAIAAILASRESGRIAAIWPVNALVLGAILATSRDQWARLLVGAFAGIAAANLVCGAPIGLALLLTSANLLEVFLVASVTRRRGAVRLMRRSGLTRFVIGALSGCVASTAFAQLGLVLLGIGASWQGAGVWFAADLLGLIIFTPIILAVVDRHLYASLAADPRGNAFSLIVLMTVSAAVFFQSDLPLLFVPPAILTILALRSGFAVAALGVLVVSIAAISATALGYGPIPLTDGDLNQQIVVLQLYLASLTLMGLVVGAAVSQRKSLVERLDRSRDAVRLRADRERQMIDHARLAERMSQVGYWTLDTRSGHVFWSAEVYRIHGVEPEAFDPGLEDALAFYVPADRQRIVDLIALKAAEREGWEFDAVLTRRSDGALRYVRSMAECQKDDAGTVTGFFGVFQDMTDERETQNHALERERRYRVLADNASDIIAIYDAEGVFSYVSPSVTETLGYAPEDMIGRTPFDFMVPDDHERIAQEFRSAVRAGAGLTIEYRMRARDGRIVWLEARPRIKHDEAGAILEIHDSVRDVTERREREAALTEARLTAEDAVRTKADFLANMSHEIRTPLNGVLGFADVLSRTRLTKDQKHYVGRIQSAGKGLSALIDDILDFSKIEAGKMQVELEPFDVVELTCEVLDLTRATIGDRLQFHLHIDQNVGPIIQGDEQRTRQVLLNLLGNAGKFTHAGSITVRAAVDEDRLEIRVEDTGVGIPAEVMPRLFSDFTQADASVARRFGGTGLGLNISRSLARLMGGDIRLESEEGTGTTAIFSIPHRITDGRRVTQPKSRPVAAERPLRVLVVDDIEANVELLQVLLGHSGHEVSTARSGQAAIERLVGDAAFDLILMDVQMPGMDGLTATRAIRGMGPGVGNIPIVALTANVMADQIAACHAAGMDDHLGKPVQRDKLDALLARISNLPSSPMGDALSPDDPLQELKLRYRTQMATFESEFARIRGLASQTRAEAIAALAHSIAGTSGSLGFMEVSACAFSLEAEAKQCRHTEGNPVTLEPAIKALLSAVDCA